MDKQPKKSKKNQRPLVFKPYLKGNPLESGVAKKSLRLMAYCFLFVFLYLIVGTALQFGGPVVRTILNLLIVLVCAGLTYMDGSRVGEGEVALGEIAHTRQEAGKAVDEKEKARGYHPAKGWVIALIAAIPLVLITLPHALTAQKQTYILQSLPRWVSGYESQREIMAPLAYYQRDASLSVMDILRMASRILIFPFVNIATTDNADALLLADRLSPLLACLPLLGFPFGYMTGPRSRAMIHGDISTSNKRAARKRRKAVKARQARIEKKNELI